MNEAYERLLYEVNASHILFNVAPDAPPADTLKAYNQAMDVMRKARAGADFDSLAVIHSQDPSAEHNKGELGYFTAFQMIKSQNEKLDLFNLLRLPEEDVSLSYDAFKGGCQKVLDRIYELEKEGKIHVAPHLRQEMDEIITHGLANVGMYHAKRPLLKNEKREIITQDFNLLYFYHNRLEGYGLEKIFK